MHTTAARVAFARVALLLLALATPLAFGEVVRTPSAAADRASAAISTRVADDVHAMVAIPVRSPDWGVNQERGSHGSERLVAILLAAMVLLSAQLWRRTALAARRDRTARRGSCAGIRGPPAFA